VNNRLLRSFTDFAAGWRSPKDPTPEELARVREEIRAHREALTQLETRETEISDYLRDSVQFEQVLPGKEYAEIHKQLLGNERVHPLDSVEELVEMRIGGTDDNKRCFARITPGKKPKLTAGIYTALVDITPEEGSPLTYRDIPGDIDAIKDMPVEPFAVEGENRTVAVILYTISGNQDQTWDRGGRPLAEALHGYLNGQAQQQGFNLVISTLSPLRDFGPWLAQQKGYEGVVNDEGLLDPDFAAYLQDGESHDQLRRMALQYLLTERDGVMNFHLGNGAYVGDIKFNPDNGQDWIMANYVYPNDVDQLTQQKQFYKTSNLRILAPHLQQILGYEAELQQKATVLPRAAISA